MAKVNRAIEFYALSARALVGGVVGHNHMATVLTPQVRHAPRHNPNIHYVRHNRDSEPRPLKKAPILTRPGKS